MAGIVWWTGRRQAALAELLRCGLSCGDAAAVLTRRFGRQITADAATHEARRLGLRSRARGGRPAASSDMNLAKVRGADCAPHKSTF